MMDELLGELERFLYLCSKKITKENMDTSNLNIEKLQTKVAQCMRADCPSAKVCLRQIVRRGCDKTLEMVQMVNPDAIVMEGDKCQLFRSTELTVYGVGFRHYLDMLSYTEAQAARVVLRAYFRNSAQLSRYRTGRFRISPEMKATIDYHLKANGVSVPLECDAYEVDL